MSSKVGKYGNKRWNIYSIERTKTIVDPIFNKNINSRAVIFGYKKEIDGSKLEMLQ